MIGGLLMMLAVAAAETPPRVALLHSNYRHGDKFYLRDTWKETDWALDVWQVQDAQQMVAYADQYDMIVLAPVWNFNAPEKTWPPTWRIGLIRGFLERGGVLIEPCCGDDAGLGNWWQVLYPGSYLKTGMCDWDVKSKPEPGASIVFEELDSTWCHFTEVGARWEIIARCEHGNPTIVTQKVGRGLAVVSTLVNRPRTKADFELLRQLQVAANPLPRSAILTSPPDRRPKLLSAATGRRRLLKVADEPEGVSFALRGMPMSYKSRIDGSNVSGFSKSPALVGARGEVAAGQVLVIYGLDLKGPLVLSTEVASRAGETPLELQAQPIDFLPMMDNEWLPEVVRNTNRLDVDRKGACKPIWVTCRIPEGAAAGEYVGTVVVSSEEGRARFPLKVRVRDFGLPTEQHLPMDFALRPTMLHAFFTGQRWEDNRWRESVSLETYKLWLDTALDYRIGVQPYDEGGFMPEGNRSRVPFTHTKWEGDELRVDWSEWDQLLDLQAAHGMRSIRVGYVGGDNPTISEANVWWKAYLPQLMQHLRGRGLLEGAFIYQRDEITAESYPGFLMMADLLREYAPEIDRLTVFQGNFPEAIDAATTIWVPSMGAYSAGGPRPKEIQAAGEPVWVYVCTSPSPPYSELFSWEDGLNHRLLPWIIRKEGLSGLLYYGLCFWCYQHNDCDLSDVKSDGTIKPSWAGGEVYGGGGMLLYPGGKQVTDRPQASFRLELLRQGLQDYEYFWLLQDTVDHAVGPRRKAALALGAKELLRIPEDIVAAPTSYTTDESLLDRRKRKIGMALERLLHVPSDERATTATGGS